MDGLISALDIVLESAAIALTLAVYAGVFAGLLAMLVLVINAFFRRWLSSAQMGLLWGLVLLRLLIPVAPSSSLSLQNLLAFAKTQIAAPIDPSRQPSADSSGVAHSQPLSAPPEVVDFQAPIALEEAPQAMDISSAIESFVMILPLVWLVAGIGYLISITIVHWRLRRLLNQVPACGDPRLHGLWEACCKLAGARRSIPIVRFDGVQQPAILGLFFPRLLLPTNATALNDQQLRMVMLHELAHVRRWDIAANWLLVVVRAIHWWNPVYWLAAARFQDLREQSCDAFAMRLIGGQPVRGYSELLLTLAQRQPSGRPWRVKLPASILGFLSSFFRKRAVHNRLNALRSAGVVHSPWHTAVVAGLIALAAVCGLTDASMAITPPGHSADWRPQAFHDWSECCFAALEIDPGPIVTRAYDIEPILTRIAGDERWKDNVRAELKSLLIHTLRGSTGQYHALTDEWAQDRLKLDDDTLTMTAPLKTHDEVSRNLHAWEQSGMGQICVETRFQTDERDLASAIGVSWQYLQAFSDDRESDLPSKSQSGMPVVRAKASVDEYLPIAVATLNKQQVIALVQASQRHRRANAFQGPNVTIFNGQEFSVQDRSQTPFVVGIQDNGAGTAQPNIAVIDEGIRLRFRATQSSDTTKVQLEGRVELSEIDEVGTATTLLRGQPTTIQVPRVKRRRIDVRSEVQDGQSLLIGCIPAFEKKRFFYVLLTMRNVQPTAENTREGKPAAADDDK